MSRTKRGVAYKHYWGDTKENVKKYAEEMDSEYFWRWYRLHGTEAVCWSPGSKYYYNRVHRIGRRIERDQLRPQNITEDFEFDDSHYQARYKGVWWDIY